LEKLLDAEAFEIPSEQKLDPHLSELSTNKLVPIDSSGRPDPNRLILYK
jgi:hypothetical protein